ncbi:protein PAT1 homolog 1-like isoform X2 [Toxorhynchites rutilus septentrionalis]|nr:protein PAT1 homolog 1-like isoform X2 [Toxorhynchites rutilus septentrionalis]
MRLDPSIWDNSIETSENKLGIQSLFPNIQSENARSEFNNVYYPKFAAPQLPINMLSVADIERNIIQKQQQQLIRERNKQAKAARDSNQSREIRHTVPPVSSLVQPMVPNNQLLAIRSRMFPPPPILNHHSRLPIGFLPYSFLPTHYSTPIKNLAMHPGLMAGVGAHLGVLTYPRVPLPMHPAQIPNVQINQFNQRLVQEIQQNHPMLSYNRPSQYQCSQKMRDRNNGQHQRYINPTKDTDYDEYSNLMSNREKQWLIGIQLTQLNADIPYISDYYFTVYKERLAAIKGDEENKTYKDNQLNHPFTQPKGHAQLLLMSSLAKNCGMLNTKGGLTNHNRERKLSESKTNGDQQRTYTPLQFENSLGKLQCGSVTAPRKIIDMDVVGNEPTTTQGNASLELSMQRKSRHVLLHIETLFKIVLKLEDLKNPAAIEATLRAKEKGNKESVAQQQTISDDRVINLSLSSNSEPESFDELLAVLTSGLVKDKVVPILGVRKGKILLRRILVLLREHPFRWDLWNTIFSSIPFMLKKDRDDNEGVLFTLYTEFERHVQYSQFSDLLKLSQTIKLDRTLSYLTSCKFLLCSVITIIFQIETFFARAPSTIQQSEQNQWIECLESITSATSKLLGRATTKPTPQHIVQIDRDNNIILMVRNHFERFAANVKGNNFVDFITADPIAPQ